MINNPLILFLHKSALLKVSENIMKIIEIGDRITLTLEGKLEDGHIFYKNNKNPSIIEIGKKQIFPALENELVGMKIGETRTITLKPIDAFGDHDENLLMSIPRDRIDSEIQTVAGNEIEVTVSEGKKLKGVIVDVTDDIITVDFNHPYAGKSVFVTCTIISIEDRS